MQDISAFGFRVNLVASNTFPQGVSITQFADDADPFDTPAIVVADKKMALNGQLVKWSAANPIEATLNVIPGSEDDTNLAILLEANRVGAGKVSAQDVVTATVIYPDGTTVTCSPGAILSGPTASSVASAGRLKSKAYMFAFENKSGS